MRRLPRSFQWTVPRTPGRESLTSPGKNYIMALSKQGCRNRPFYHIIITKTTYPKLPFVEPLEQVGTYDPLINQFGEKLCALNIERILYYLAHGIELEKDVAQLLGLAGLLPQHPTVYKTAWRNRWEFRREELKRQVEELEAASAGTSARGAPEGSEEAS